MATATFYVENNSSYSFWESSYFQSWTYNSGSGVTNGYTTPSNVTFDKVFGTSSIPSGSTINSALLYATVSTGTYGGTAKHAGSTNYSGLDIKASVTAGVDTSVPYYWKSNTGGSYPATPGIGVTVYSDKTGSAQWSAIRLVVDYTLPYGDVNPPTSLSIATNVAPSTTQRLSWSGATGGTNTTVASYQVFSSADSYATAIGSTANAYLDVTSSASNGGAITYKVLSVSSPAGYNSSLSTATAVMTTTWTAPTVPQNVAVSPASLVSGNATLSWSASSNGTNNTISGYRIDRATAAGGPWSALVASQTGTSLTVAAHTTKGSSYFYRVEALAPLANSGVSASAQLLTDWSNPTAPSIVSMSATNLAPNTTATLSWSGADNGTNNAIASYDIHIMRQGESVYSYLKSTTGMSTTVTSPAANGTDSYQVKAMGTVSGYNSAISTATATLATQFTAPVTPVSLSLSYNNVYPSREVSLSWAASGNGTNNPFVSYQILRADTVGGTRTVLVASQSATSLNITAKSANGSYFYWVVAVGTYSNATSASIELVTTFAAPTTPSNVGVSPATVGTSGSATLSWTASTGGTNNAFTGYLVERATASSGPWSTLVASQSPTTLGVTGQVANGSTYYYRVTALAPYANSAVSATAQLATSYAPPSTPGGLTLSSNDVAPSASVNLTWNASTDGTNNVVSGYQVERSLTSTSGFASIATNISKTNRTLAVTARDAGGQDYYYRVIALAPNGSSAASASIELRTTVGTIAAPTTLRINSATSSTVSPATAVSITWVASAGVTNNAVTGYKILESSSSGSGYTEKGTAAAGATSFAMTTIASEGTRYYKIYATGTYSNSAETAYVSITVSLDTADASTVAMSPAGIDIGTQTTATITPSNAGYNHKIWITFGSETSTAGTLAAGTNTWAYTPPSAWMNQIPNAPLGTATVTLETYSGTTLKGIKTTSLVLYVPSTVVPTLASFAGTRVNNTVPAAWGLYVVSKSQVDLAMGAGAGVYGSTITNYLLTGGGMNISSVSPISQISPVLTAVSTTYTARVTDSRNRSQSYDVVITAEAYMAPTLAADTFRCVIGGTENDQGTYGSVKATSTFASISTKNSVVLSSKYRLKNTTNNYATISSGMTNGQAMVFGSGGIATDKYYEVVYTAVDAVGSTTILTDEISVSAYLLHYRYNGLGFGVGGPAGADNTMDVHWKLRANSGIDLSGTITKNVPANDYQDILYGTMGDNDQYRIRAGGANNEGYLEIATADDGTEPIYVRQYTGVFSTLNRTLTLLDGSGNTSVPGTLTIGGATAYHSSNLKIGGTNLVPNSIINTTSAAYGFESRVIPLKNSTTYTMTVRAKRNAPSAQLLTHIVNGSYNWSIDLFTATDDYSIQSTTFTTSANVESYTSALLFFSYPNGNGGTVTVDWVKIEKGTIATDHSPAPEDKANTIHNHTALSLSGLSLGPGGEQFFNAATNASIFGAPQRTTYIEGLSAIKFTIGNGTSYTQYDALHSGNWSSYCAPASHGHGYVPLVGGSMTGRLDITTGLSNKVMPTAQDLVINGISSTAIADAPGIGMHIASVTWANIKLASDASFRFYNSELSGYVPIRASSFYENDVPLSSKYLSLGGGALSGTLCINHSSGGNYNEGLRINRSSSNSYATLVIGGATGSTEGTAAGVWGIFNPPGADLVIACNSSSSSGGLSLPQSGATFYWRDYAVLTSGNWSSYAQKIIGYGTSLPTSGMVTGDIFIKTL